MPSIIEQYRYLHEQGWFPGGALEQHVPEIARLVKEYDAKTLLDYGCGKAKNWGWAAEKIKVTPTLYDPGYKPFSKRPAGKFDGVICTDVLEHVEDPDWVLADILGYATKFAFIDVSCQQSPPHKKLPDGRPLHICVKPPAWWRAKVAALEPKIPVILRFDVDEAG